MGSLLSRTITLLRFPMIFFILYLHITLSGNTETIGYEIFQLCFKEGLSRIFVPLFFFLSGFLFFYYIPHFDKAIYQDKIKRRFKTLLVPYLFWNLFVIVLYFIGQTFTPSMVSDSVKIIVDYSWSDWLRCFWNIGNGCPINLPLWFLRDLIILSVLTPIIYKMLANHLGVVTTGLLWLFVATPTHWSVGIFFFTLGAWIGIRKVDPVTRLLPYRWWWITLYLIFISIGLGLRLNEIEEGNYFQKVGILMGMCAVLSWTGYFLRQHVPSNKWERSSFFVYAYHSLPLLLVCKLVMRYLQPETSIALIVCFLVIPIIISVIGVITCELLHRFFPCLTNWICGR